MKIKKTEYVLLDEGGYDAEVESVLSCVCTSASRRMSASPPLLKQTP